MVENKTMTEAILDYLVFRRKKGKYMVTTSTVIKALQKEYPTITNTTYQLFAKDLRDRDIIQVAGKGVRNAKVYKIIPDASTLKDIFYAGKPRAKRLSKEQVKEAGKKAAEDVGNNDNKFPPSEPHKVSGPEEYALKQNSDGSEVHNTEAPKGKEVTALQLGEGMIMYVQSLKDKLNQTDSQLREALLQGKVIASQSREIKALEKRVKEWEDRMEGAVPAAKYKELHEKHEDLKQEFEALKTKVEGTKFNIGELHLG